MKTGPAVSIIMPAYNSGETILAAIFSVIEQSFENWELLIIDDGSPEDLSADIAILRDSRLKYHKLRENMGLAHALNTGLKLAENRFVARMDADDIMEPWRIRDQLRFMIERRLTVLGTAADKFGAESGRMHSPGTPEEIYDCLLLNNPFIHPTVMFDRERLNGELLYNEDFKCEEDYELWIRIITPDNCANIDYSTLRYRVSSTSNANRPEKKYFNLLLLEQFADRIGLRHEIPVKQLSELQLSGFLSAESYQQLLSYAAKAEKNGWPRLGWIQQPLLSYGSYYDFTGWFLATKGISVYRF